MSDYVVMAGKDFDNPEKCVKTKVHKDNIEAFRASGWEIVDESEECAIEEAKVYSSPKKKEEEKSREPIKTAPQTLNTEPIEEEPNTATPKEASKKTIKK